MRLLALGLVLASREARADPPEPPPWQRELDAAQLAETVAALATANEPARAAEADRRLGELYRQLAARYPGQAAVRKAAGDHFWRTGDEAGAIAQWQAAQTLAPGDGETASALGSAWLRDGRTAAARDQYQRAVDARPDVARYHYDLANVLYLFRHEQPDAAAALYQAMGHFRRASELAADNLEFARAYAETFYGLPQPDWPAALTAWDHVRTLTASNPDFANSHLARISLKLGKPDQAEGYLEAIRDPAFASMKATLHRRAEEMKQKTAVPAP